MEEPTQEDSDKLELSSHAFAALQEFYSEQDQQKERFEELKSAAERKDSEVEWSMKMFAEDWNASQFWYNEETARVLAKELLRDSTCETHIAVVSAPSAFIHLKDLLGRENWPHGKPEICLLEYDQRFSVLPEFVHYNFERPLYLDPRMKGRYDRILCDPPFLSPDCQTKVAITVRWLSQSQLNKDAATKPRIIVCTGERMEETIHKLYPGIQTTTFEPRHAQDRLSNDFRCYANFPGGQWSFR
ncbi:MAG: hypothetical protein Q9163_004590 [Psora crenata]